MFCLLATVLTVALVTPHLCAAVDMLPYVTVEPNSFTPLRSSGRSTLYQIDLPAGVPDGPMPGTGMTYDYAPLLLDVHGTRFEIGWDYAALMANESAYTLDAFFDSTLNSADEKEALILFVDWLWDNFLSPHVPDDFQEELAGMRAYHAANPNPSLSVTTDLVAQRFFTVANLPEDSQNIVAMLENELEPASWPWWLKDALNLVIDAVERMVNSCDSFGVWGSRTQDGLLYTSRNLDFKSNTGINRYKLITVYHIENGNSTTTTSTISAAPPVYATLGYSYGMGALAGISSAGITVSEMNLDNSVVTFDGVPFPLRLRMVLEQATDLESARRVWDSTNNTNSFNFLIGSASDALAGNDGANALETMRGYTGWFGANSEMEKNAQYYCGEDQCRSWTDKTGLITIGHPLPEAVWRSNHGMDVHIMTSQEALFNDTVFRYDLMHKLFVGLEEEQTIIDDKVALGVAATLGTKGKNYLTCDQDLNGDNIMSIVYGPGPRSSASTSSVSDNTAGHFYIAWESGSGSSWKPAACSPYVYIDLQPWVDGKYSSLL